MKRIRDCFFRDELFKFGRMKSFVFGCSRRGHCIFFRIWCINHDLMVFVDFMYFIIIRDGKMYSIMCSGVGVGGVGGVGVGGGGMKNCDVVDIETCNPHIHSFELLKLSTDGFDELFYDLIF